MISIEQARKLINDSEISDKDVEVIRDNFRLLAEVIFNQWQKERSEDLNLTQEQS
ncbi:MAG: hypothetical protein HQ530_05660 [Parcubacteria group bacterium]|nr:hypothetical protein [Parcubacteria group bacterium]